MLGTSEKRLDRETGRLVRRGYLTRQGLKDHEKFYRRNVQVKLKRRQPLTDAELVEHLRALGGAREPYEEQLLRRLTRGRG